MSKALASSTSLPASVSTSLIDVGSALKPQSFALSALHSEEFDARAFVAERRQHAPLSLVRDELRAYTNALSSRIVQAVQRDFSVLTGLGTSLTDATILAAELQPSVKQLRERLEELHASLQVHAESLNTALARRREVYSRRVALQTLVTAHESLVKCERLLRQYSSTSSSASSLATDPLSSQALGLLDRITAETAQLSFTVSRSSISSAFLDTLSVRVSAVKRQVRASLDACLQRALPSDREFDSETLARVLALYVIAGMSDDAYDFFGRQIVAPFTAQRLRMGVMLAAAERKIQSQSQSQSQSPPQSQPKSQPPSTSSNNLNSSNSPPVTPGDALRAAHDEIVAFLGDRVLPVVSLCQSDARLARRLDFVGNAVWPQVQRAISMHMGAAFSPGIPDVFHRSFRAGTDIFAAIEAAAGDEFRSALCSSSTTAEFWKHWNLPVYFQLRFQEISSAFEEQLAQGPIASNVSTGAGVGSRFALAEAKDFDARLLRSDVYRASATVALVSCLRRCWAEEVYLAPLTHRFVRLSLQVLARYSTWVRTGLAGEWTESDGVARGAARVVRDIGVLQERLPTELASLLRARCANLDGRSVEAIESGFAEAINRFGTLIPDIVQSIEDAIGQACTENLQPLRGIIATYRMSSKQAPTRHSSFVPKILRPLRVFLKDHEGSSLDDDVVTTLVRGVVGITSEQYLIMVTDLIERNKSNEATLKRLNIGRSSAALKPASGGGGLSVVQKITMQLYLDVEQFADEVFALGVDVSGVSSLHRLRENVRHERDACRENDVNDNVIDNVNDNVNANVNANANVNTASSATATVAGTDGDNGLGSDGDFSERHANGDIES